MNSGQVHASVVERWATADGVELDSSDAPDALTSFLDRNPGLSTRPLIATTSGGVDGR